MGCGQGGKGRLSIPWAKFLPAVQKNSQNLERRANLGKTGGLP